MEHDRDFPKFFVYLNLFVFAMLMLVLSDNFCRHSWGGRASVSARTSSSRFWFERERASRGQEGGSSSTASATGLHDGDVPRLRATGARYLTDCRPRRRAAFAGGHRMLLFPGAVGKSAQLPLFRGCPTPWKARAGLGPDPRRDHGHRGRLSDVPDQPAAGPGTGSGARRRLVGAATALLGATIACAQDDIKRVLAYSTILQLGYMFIATGFGAYVAGFSSW